MDTSATPPHCRALGLLVLAPLSLALMACTQAVENKQVNKPLTSLADVGAPVVHSHSGLRFPSRTAGWSRMLVSPQAVKEPILTVSYNSGMRRIESSSYGMDRTATITVSPAAGRSVEDVLNQQIAKVQRKHQGDQITPLKTPFGSSAVVSYFDSKRGWHLGREVCVVPHKDYMVVYEVDGTKAHFEEGYSQLEALTGVIHGLKN